MTGFLILALWVSVGLLILVGGTFLCVTDADADQGPPPTLRPVRDAASLPFGLDDGLADYHDAWERSVAEARADFDDEPAPMFEALCFERWERELDEDRRRR
jgi:hypothetical protein